MWRLLSAAVAATLIAAAAPGAGAGAPAPRCFGAASHDPRRPCHNPALDRVVRPTPTEALLTVDARPCHVVPGPAPACWFGVAPGRGKRTVALVGDSHAEHWRTPLYDTARRLRWTIYRVTHASCHFTKAVPDAPPEKRDPCLAYNRDALAWLRAHPEVSAILTSAHPGPVVRRPGETMIAAWVRGIRAQWRAMPATVAHVIVLRDVPFIDAATLPCVERAMRRRADAGRACRIARRRALHHDPNVVAAEREGARRAAVADLTPFFCDRRWCPPVIGGALVYKDAYAHLTATYGRTLGPYLTREILRSISGWSTTMPA